MLHKKFLQQASFNQMQYLFKQQTIFKNVAITLKNMHAFLQAKQHNIYWEITTTLCFLESVLQSCFDSNSACLEYKKCEPSFCLNKKPHKCYLCEINIAPSEEK